VFCRERPAGIRAQQPQGLADAIGVRERPPDAPRPPLLEDQRITEPAPRRRRSSSGLNRDRGTVTHAGNHARSAGRRATNRRRGHSNVTTRIGNARPRGPGSSLGGEGVILEKRAGPSTSLGAWASGAGPVRVRARRSGRGPPGIRSGQNKVGPPNGPSVTSRTRGDVRRPAASRPGRQAAEKNPRPSRRRTPLPRGPGGRRGRCQAELGRSVAGSSGNAWRAIGLGYFRAGEPDGPPRGDQVPLSPRATGVMSVMGRSMPQDSRRPPRSRPPFRCASSARRRRRRSPARYTGPPHGPRSDPVGSHRSFQSRSRGWSAASPPAPARAPSVRPGDGRPPGRPSDRRRNVKPPRAARAARLGVVASTTQLGPDVCARLVDQLGRASAGRIDRRSCPRGVQHRRGVAPPSGCRRRS